MAFPLLRSSDEHHWLESAFQELILNLCIMRALISIPSSPEHSISRSETPWWPSESSKAVSASLALSFALWQQEFSSPHLLLHGKGPGYCRLRAQLNVIWEGYQALEFPQHLC